jgi:hypothetical protein
MIAESMPVSSAPYGIPPPGETLAAPVPPRRISTAVVLLAGLLGIALIALTVSIAIGVRSHRTAVEQRDQAQSRIDARNSADAALRKRFDDADFVGRYRRVREADDKLETAFQAWLDAPTSSAAERTAARVWEQARKDCLQLVTDYQMAAQSFPRDWFGALSTPTPSVVDLTQADTDCWYLR